MNSSYSFIWPININDAKEIQKTLQQKIVISPLTRNPRSIAGVDAAFLDDRVVGVASLFAFPELRLIEETYAELPSSFPYIPGFLSFREGPALIEALKKLKSRPDIILFDGQGLAHPKKLGIATHIGVLLDTPSVGSAKSRLIGKYEEPGPKKGAWSALHYRNEPVGSVLRTRDYTKPVFVSPGHMADVKTAREIILACSTKFRIPEPLRRADSVSKKIKKQLLMCS
jgi:deoxyribonuclease V